MYVFFRPFQDPMIGGGQFVLVRGDDLTGREELLLGAVGEEKNGLFKRIGQNLKVLLPRAQGE